MSYKHRLSPSGPYIGDPPLEVGPGSLGLKWRAQGTSAVVTPLAAGGLAVDGMDLIPFALPAGYHYDVHCNLEFSGAAGGELVTCHVQYSEDGGGTWLPPAASVCRENVTTLPANGSGFHEQEIEWNRTFVGALPVTHMRVMLFGPATASVRNGNCALRVEQYHKVL